MIILGGYTVAVWRMNRLKGTMDSNKALEYIFWLKSWDAHTSPWVYNELYGDKFLWPKTIAFMIIVVVVVTALLLGIVYVLDTLKII